MCILVYVDYVNCKSITSIWSIERSGNKDFFCNLWWFFMFNSIPLFHIFIKIVLQYTFILCLPPTIPLNFPQPFLNNKIPSHSSGSMQPTYSCDIIIVPKHLFCCLELWLLESHITLCRKWQLWGPILPLVWWEHSRLTLW